MPFEIKEFKTSRSGVYDRDTQNRLLQATGYGTTDDSIAKAAFQAWFPLYFDGLTRGPISYDTLGGLMWAASAPYTPDDAPLYPGVGIVGPPLPVPVAETVQTPLGPNFTFDLNGVNEHIVQSKATISKTKRGGLLPAKDNQRAIGISEDGEVKGCDRLTGFIEWRMSVTFEFITHAFIQTLGDRMFHTNKYAWRGYPIGTLLFMGGNLQTKDTTRAVGEFKFGYSKNLTSIPICEGLTVPAKNGWDYLWISYLELQDIPAKKLTQQPDSAYVERIYDEFDFTELRVG